MPRASARAVGSLNAFGSMIETAIPSAFSTIARFIAVTISPTSLRIEPVQRLVVPSSAHASSIP